MFNSSKHRPSRPSRFNGDFAVYRTFLIGGLLLAVFVVGVGLVVAGMVGP